jgi:hypothetical protein
MTPDYSALQFWVIIINSLITAIFAGYSWWCNREKVTNRRFTTLESQVKDMVGKPELSKIKEARDLELAGVRKSLDNIPLCCQGHATMEKRLTGHSDRLGQHKELIVKIEAEFKAMPKKHDLDAVYERVNQCNTQMSDLRSEVGKIAGAMPGLTHITEMMNEFLLRQGGKN